VGYTHEKVDRDLFATIRNLKTFKNCEIPDKFPKCYKELSEVSPQASFLRDPIFWDWKSYFGDNLRSIKNFTAFQAFIIKCDGLNQPELFYKKNILDLTWLGFEGSLIQDLLI
jgi:hypothetical protein